MRQILAVAFLGMSLAFTASAALAETGEHSTLPPQLQGQEVVMVGTGSGSATAVDTDQSPRPSVHEPNDRR